MKTIFLSVQIVLSVILSAAILIQSRGTGFGRGSGGVSGAASFTRRGLEKIIFRATFVLSLLFLLISVLSVAI